MQTTTTVPPAATGGALKDKLEKHAQWSRGEPGGERADLGGANLRGANLRGANLYGANLRGANLGDAAGSDEPAKVGGSCVVLTGDAGYWWMFADTNAGPVLRFGCELRTVKDWKKNLAEVCDSHDPTRAGYFARVIKAAIAYGESVRRAYD